MKKAFAAAFLVAGMFASASATANSPDVKLIDSFDDGGFAPAGGLYYHDDEEQRAGTFEFQHAVTRTGRGALKLTVKPSCAAMSEGCSERAEIREKTALRVPYDQAIWYGIAVKFADPVPRDDHRYVIAQWKREIGPDAKGDFSPFLALRLGNGRLFATVETNYSPAVSGEPKGRPAHCAGDQTPVWLRPETNQMRALVVTDSSWEVMDGALFNACSDKISITDRGNALPLPDSGWIDFAIMTRPGPDGSGHIEIFANGKWITTIKGQVGHSDPGLGKNQYFKFGPYRAPGTSAWSLYYDDFRRSTRCEDVLGDNAACALIQ
ncbi:MAG: hypothetical protein JWM58_4568 [Rhizobium sp.]|nr:hypothetical protein [Rhizobium sp.]